MQVTVFGTGYVGLVTGACLAEVGHDVLCVDVDAAKLEGIEAGILPMYEPGLDEIVAAGMASQRLSFTTDAERGVGHGEVLMIAVGTPADRDGTADLSKVDTVARSIGRHLNDHPGEGAERSRRILVTKSTVPVGTLDRVTAIVRETLAERGVDQGFDVASNPEFLKEGDAVNDFMRPDRIIIGTESEHARRRLERLYAPFNRQRDRIIHMDPRSAELCKYAANAMLATRISFMNDMANIAERVGADIEQVRVGIGADPRIGFDFIYPGVGFGGSCFPKDVRALSETARRAGHPSRILQAVSEINEDQKTLLFRKLEAHFGDLAGRTVALWGLAFKPNTDDMREAPSRSLMEALWVAGGRVRAFDPAAMTVCREIYGDRDDLVLCDEPYACLDGADCLVVVTEWKSFRILDVEEARARLAQPVIFDGRNIYQPGELRAAGFTYYAIGRPHSDASEVTG